MNKNNLTVTSDMTLMQKCFLRELLSLDYGNRENN
jgi:hypothetical protein